MPSHKPTSQSSSTQQHHQAKSTGYISRQHQEATFTRATANEATASNINKQQNETALTSNITGKHHRAPSVSSRQHMIVLNGHFIHMQHLWATRDKQEATWSPVPLGLTWDDQQS